MILLKTTGGDVVSMQELRKGTVVGSGTTYSCAIAVRGDVVKVVYGTDIPSTKAAAQAWIDELVAPFLRTLPGGMEIVIIDDFKLSGCGDAV